MSESENQNQTGYKMAFTVKQHVELTKKTRLNKCLDAIIPYIEDQFIDKCKKIVKIELNDLFEQPENIEIIDYLRKEIVINLKLLGYVVKFNGITQPLQCDTYGTVMEITLPD